MNTSPSQTLRDLMVRYGRSLYDDPCRLEALLRDFCGTHRQAISVLTSAARERIPPDLLTSVSAVPVEVAIAQQAKRLQTNLGLAEASARWSVESWAFALGLISETDITTPELLTSAHQPPVLESHRRETVFQPQITIPQTLSHTHPVQPIQPMTPTPKTLSVRYANFWTRVAAYIIDIIVINIIGAVVGTIAGLVLGAMYVIVMRSDSGIESLNTVFVLLGIIVGWLYYAILESSNRQATIGKRIMNIQVTDLNGQRVSFGRATARYFSKLISAFIFLIGFLMPLFDPKKQALHDKISGCLIVKK